MDRRRFGGLILAACLAGSMAMADGLDEQIMRQLQDDGYTEISREKTWLGRIRITAVSADGTREIILNPATGEILRDLWIAGGGKVASAPLIRDTVKPSKGSGGGAEPGDDGTDGGDDGGDDKGDDSGDDDKNDDKGDDKNDDKDDSKDDSKDDGGNDD